jgi:succinate dehydrogenase / fumarate reductase cytochrome b subunit
MLTTAMSIVHRITGAALYIGMLLLVWWLMAAASGPRYFDFVQGLFSSWLGRLVLFGCTWALLHHALGGIRHLVWDAGYGFGLRTIEWTARATLAGSVALTILLWIIAYAVKS